MGFLCLVKKNVAIYINFRHANHPSKKEMIIYIYHGRILGRAEIPGDGAYSE